MSEKRFLVEKSRWRALGRAASRVPRLSGGVVGARQRDVGCVSSLQNESKPCRKRVHLVQTWKSHPSGRSWTQLKVSVLCFDLVSDWLWACERLYGCDHSGFLWVCPAQTLQVYGHILLLVSCFCVYFSNIKWNNNPVISRSASVSFSFLCLFLNFIYVLFYWWMFTENGQSWTNTLMLVYVKVISVRGELRPFFSILGSLWCQWAQIFLVWSSQPFSSGFEHRSPTSYAYAFNDRDTERENWKHSNSFFKQDQLKNCTMVQKETQEHNGRFKHLYLFFILCFFLSARYIKKGFFLLYIL